mgnify:CR=1 FL=1|jgi:hypothetical protein
MSGSGENAAKKQKLLMQLTLIVMLIGGMAALSKCAATSRPPSAPPHPFCPSCPR